MYFNSNSWWSKTKQFMIKWGEKKKNTEGNIQQSTREEENTPLLLTI